MVSVLFENPANELNASAMARTCEFFGVPFYVSRPVSAVPSVRRTSAELPVLNPLTWGGRLIVTDSMFTTHPYEIQWRTDDLLVMGNEHEGVSKSVAKLAREWVGLPKHGDMACLNVNAACAAILALIDAKERKLR